MAEKDVLEAIGKLTVAVEALTESGSKETQAAVDADALSTAVKAGVQAYADATAAIDAAELLPSQEADLRDRAANGEDVTTAIESAKVIATEAREAAGVQANKTPTPTVESAQFSEGAGADYQFKGFGRNGGK